MNYKELLNPAQYEAATNEDKRLLILAGAGTGKTHTMIFKTAYLVEHGMPPENILLLTFTNKAAREMVSRLEKYDIKGVTACTFHSFCAAVLRAFCKNKDFTILNQSDTEETIRMYLEKDFLYKAGTISSIDSYSVNRCIPVRDAMLELLGDDTEWEKVEEIIKQAKEYRLDHHTLSYDDLLTETVVLLGTETSSILRGKYRYIMVDEYQDTNTLQDRILDLIDPEYLAVVGDDCQSLYAFRGADVKNILSFPERHKCEIIKLEENYRSTQNILDLTNVMMERYCEEGIPKWLTSIKGPGEMPLLHRPSDVYEEAQYVARYIKEWLDRGNAPQELCVLVRTARASSYLESILTAGKIPFEKRGGPKFFETKHIQDVMSLFELTINKRNRIAWFRSLMLIRNIGKVNARKISDRLTYSSDISCYSKKKFYNDLCTLIKKVSCDSEWHETLHELCIYYIDQTVRVLSESSAKDKAEMLEAVKSMIKPDLDILENIASEYDDRTRFLDSIMTDNIEEDSHENIIISTIHSAKGLEFEFVILMGASEGVFPRKYTDEELRCMYVALTRPKHYLLITSPEYYMTNQGIRKTGRPKWFD